MAKSGLEWENRKEGGGGRTIRLKIEMHPPQDSLFPAPPWGRSRARNSGPRNRSGHPPPRLPDPVTGVGGGTSGRRRHRAPPPPPSGFSLTHRPRPLPPSFPHCPSAGRRERVSRPDRGPVCISAWGSLAPGSLAASSAVAEATKSAISGPSWRPVLPARDPLAFGVGSTRRRWRREATTGERREQR